MSIDWWLSSLRFKQYYTLRNSGNLLEFWKSGNYKAKKKKEEGINKKQIRKRTNQGKNIIHRQSFPDSQYTHILVHIFLPPAVTQQNPQQFNF